MGKGSKLRRKNSMNSSSSFNGNGKDEKKKIFLQCAEDKDKDDQISQQQPCKRCEVEMFKLRELNQRLIKDVNNSRQDLKACFSHKVEDMESHIHILQAASTNFESKIDNQFLQQVKIGEQLSDQLMEIDKEFRQQLAKRDAGISKAWHQLQEAEERFGREISEKENNCRAVFSDKQTLESSVLQLTHKIKVISGEFEAACKAWELEKDGLFLQIASGRKETEEMAESRLIAEQAWSTDKENLLSSLGRTYEKKIEDICALNQRVLFEKATELESQLNESKDRTQELLEKLEDGRHLWDSEKQELQGNAAELQTKIDSMATQGGLLCQKNKALSAEVESLGTQLNEKITRMDQMQDEKVQNERVLQQYRSKYVDLQSSFNDSEAKTRDLLRKIEEDTHLWEAEKNNLESQLNESKQRTRELLEKLEDDRHLWDSEKHELQCNAAELQTKIDSMATEGGLLCQKNKALSAEVESLGTQLNENITRMDQMQDERVQYERVLQQYRTENIDLQSSFNDSKAKTQALLCKIEEDTHLWDAEKNILESQLNESKQRTRELLGKLQDDRHLWDSEKQELQRNAAELQTKIDSMAAEGGLLCQENRSLSAEVESLKAQLNENTTRIAQMQDERVQNERVLKQYRTENIDLQSNLNDSKAETQALLCKIEEDTHLWDAEKNILESQLNESMQKTRELLEKLEDDRHLWDSEKQELQCNAAELQTKIDSMATEGGLLCQENRSLSAEVESLKAQLNDNITRMDQMQDEWVQNERVLQQYRTKNIDLQSSLNDSKAETQALLCKIEEDTNLWVAEKNILESIVAKLRAEHELMACEMGSLTLKNRDLTVDAEFIKSQVNALESELNDSRKSNLELQRKTEAEWHLWDKERSNLESALAELQTKHEDLMLQLSRKKAFEEELLSRMSSLEEMRESISKGEKKIATLSSRILAVAEEKDAQLSDIEGQLSAMVEEKSELDQLSSIPEGKKILEEEIKSLQTELDRRTLVAEEEKLRLEGRVREMQTTFNSLQKELESTRAIACEKERQFVNLQNQHSELVEAKRCLENKNESLRTEFDRCTMVSEENIRLQKTIGELEMAVESLKKKEIETKDNRVQKKLISERQPPSRIPVAPPVANGKPKPNVSLNETPKSNANANANAVVHQKEESKVTPEKRTTVRKPLVPKRNPKPNGGGGVVQENQKSMLITPEKRTTTLQKPVVVVPKRNENPNPKPKPNAGVGVGVHENQKSKSMVTPEKRTTTLQKAAAQRPSPNLAWVPQNPKATRPILVKSSS